MKQLMGLIAGLAVAVAGFAPAARAAEGGTAYIVTYFETSPAAKGQASGLLRVLARASRKEAGNLRFEVLQRLGQPDQFAVLEAWKDGAAQAAHAGAEHTKQFRDQLKGFLRGAYDERPHTALEVGEVKAKAGRNAVFAITHVDIVPKDKDTGVALVKDLAANGRKFKGNVRFEALTQNSRTNHMTVVEIWANRKALEAHSIAPQMKAFREKVSPLSGSLYDERLYHALD